MSIHGWMDTLHVMYLYNRTLTSHRKECSPDMCHNMAEPWGYCAKWIKSDGERQMLYDFIHVEYKKWTTTKDKNKRQTLECIWHVVVTRWVGEGRRGNWIKGVQLYGDAQKLDLLWWVLCNIYRCWIIMLYPWSLYNVINQCYFNKKECTHKREI